MSVQFTDTRYQPRQCPTCGADVVGHWRKKYCSRPCAHSATNQSARARKRAEFVQEFVGVDGEGVNLPDGSHRYVMLSCGQETLFNVDGLTYREILPFLYGCFLNNDERLAYVGFYLGYDFTHWFKDISEHEATMLFTPTGIAARQRREGPPMPFPVYIPGWEVDMLGMKRLRFRPHQHNSKRNICGCGYRADNLPSTNGHKWMIICDVGAFFQTSFVNVLDPTAWRGETPCTSGEYATIIEGKSKRAAQVSDSDLSWRDEMEAYNRLENRLLANVMRIYNGGFTAMGVTLNKQQFFGPGQAAQQWLTNRVKKGAFITHEQIGGITPDWVIDTWRRTYYGGRFEILYHGIVPDEAREYDIQSAYPDAIRSLPCLCGTQWRETASVELDSLTPAQQALTIVHTYVESSQARIGPLPHRTKAGAIVYPQNTYGWYQLTEIEAAMNSGLIGRMEVDSIVYPTRLCNHPPPLAALADLFAQRLAVGKATPHGKALKLIYNSVYGKFAQSIGQPKYGNPIYASMITSSCRTRILQVIGEHDLDALVMIATDGIYYTTPHPTMPTPDTNVEHLGAWECTLKHNLTLFKPGVYWDDKARDAISEGYAAKLKSRGISAAALQDHINNIDTVFRQGDGEMPTIVIRSPFNIVSPRLALARGKWDTCARVEYDLERTDRATIPPKRVTPEHIAGGLYRSHSPRLRNPESHPYDKRFGFDPDGQELLTDEYYAPDGLAIQNSKLAILDIMGHGE